MPRLRAGLAARLLGTTGIAIAIVSWALSSIATRQLETRLEGQFRSKGEAIALALAFAIELQKTDDTHERVRTVQGLIDAASTIDGVRYIYVQDSEESILVHTFKPHFPPSFVEMNWIAPGELGTGRVKVADRVAIELPGRTIAAIDVAAPIANSHLGVAHVGMDRDVIDAQVAELRRAMAVFAILIALAGLLGAGVLVTGTVIAPVKALDRAAAEVVRTGRLDVAIHSRAGGEIGDLIASFNAMLEELRKSRDKIEATMVELADVNTALVAGRESEAAKGRELELQNKTLREQSLILKAQQRALDEKNRELEKASRLKSEFLANMSHELRTPMNSIIGYTDLVLTRGAVSDEKSLKNLERVLSNAQHLLTLINSILDLSKIEAGKMELFEEEADLVALLDAVVATSEVLVKEKPVRLVKRIAADVPRRMIADQTKVRQVVLNLLSNACKFTEKGEVCLAASVKDGRLEIEVSDSGIGISERDLPIIFEEFRQVDGSSSRRFAGTGLGLAIVKKMVVLMGGKIRVHSVPDRGSTFTVSLPLHAGTRHAALETIVARAAVKAAERAVKSDLAPGQRTILVIDDEPDCVVLVRENLEGHPYNVIPAFSADEGLAMARKHKPFAVIVDVMMPEKDGWDFLRELKGDPETADIPVIVLSIVDNRPLATSLGAADYLLKPLDSSALLETLSRLHAIRHVLVVDDDADVRAILTGALHGAGYAAESVEGGTEALAYLERSRPDLIVLDLMMPGMDGFEFVRRLRGDPRWSRVPVMICTAKDLTVEEKTSLEKTVSGVLQKGSLQQETLLATLGEALRRIESDLALRAAG